jgi:crotonobetainyl-CoA:carnitine CoA-transferase CaiB-like acyl-CoA transferase
LSGIRVLDLTRILAGPFATMTLGDLGADIIKIERLGGDETRNIPPHREGVSHYYLSVNRNKRSVAVDLKQESGHALLLDLVEVCDVVVENFRPGVAERLGLDYETLRQRREDIIYCSISGFGQTGAWAGRASFDIAAQALSGAMSVTGYPGEPPARLGLPVGDLSAGLYATIGVVAAVVERQRTGRGQRIDVSMLDSTIGLLGYLASAYFMTGKSPERVGGGHHSVVPYGVFAASDGDIVLAGLTDAFWPKLCAALGLNGIAEDPRFAASAQRVDFREELNEVVGDAISRRSVADWCDRLTAADVPHAPVLSVGEALDLEPVHERNVVRRVEHPVLGEIDMLGPVVRFPDREEADVTAPPGLGADTEEVVRGLLGYSEERWQRLVDDEVTVDDRGPDRVPAARPDDARS